MQFGSAFRSPMVGLDIGSSAVKAVVLRRSRAGWSLVCAGEAPVPEDPGNNGAPADPTTVSETVSGLLDSLRLRRARVAAALAGHAVIVKRLSLPSMTDAELAEAIPWEAEQYIPFDLSEVHLDYQVVKSGTDAGRNALDVLLVAAKRERIDDRAAVVAQSGRRPVVLDIEAFALANAYRMNYPERDEPLTVLLHVGRTLTLVCLLEQGHPVFTRDIAVGGQLHLDTLKREFAGTAIDDLSAKRMLHGQMPSNIAPDQVTGVMRQASQQLVAEVRSTIDFYRATAPIEKISRVVVSGGACEAAGFTEFLGAEFNAPVEILDPFRRVTRPSRGVGADAIGPAYAVAVGLAMRQEGDR